jgi:hypothetical protein
MDRRERYKNDEEMIRLALRGFQSRLWTALPGIVETFDADKMIVSVQPSINGRVRSADGTVSSIKMPLLLDCPVLWQGGGGVTLTFPIKNGDECLVVIASRCIDAWWSQGGVQDPPDIRMHNLSDGFALVGVRSVPRKFTVDTNAAQLRSDDGNAFVEINPTTKQIKARTTGDVVIDADGDLTATIDGDVSATVGGDITATVTGNVQVTATGNVSVQAATITLKGNIVLDGPISQTNTAGGSTTASLIGPVTVTNNVTAAGTSLHTHTHGGVATGSNNTGTPN